MDSRRMLTQSVLSAAVLLFVSGTHAAYAQLADPLPAAHDVTTHAAPVPIAIVPVSVNATVTGALEVTSGKAMIATAGSIASDRETTEVTLPRRGVLKVCAGTTVKLTADASVPAGETPGLMLALDHGAVEASFAIGRNSDVLLTPDFRILIGGPGAAEVKVRLGQHGDTCVDNPDVNAPYVVVTSVFDTGAYRVLPGQRVMFQHGSLQEVVDQEKEPCGCPPPARPGTNDFPLDQSAGLAPLTPPVTSPSPPPAPESKQPATPAPEATVPLIYEAPKPAQPTPEAARPTAQAKPAETPAPAPAAEKPKKKNFFKRLGGMFRRIFGGE